LDKKVVPVFFSYKKKDERAAKEIVKILRTNSAGRLRITYQADFTKQIAGREWREMIRASIWESNWFILLLPDPSDELDWCLFETGLFAARITSADRLICIHHPDTKVPDQIGDYQAVSAAIPEVEEFLKMVYVTENPLPGMKPINRVIEGQIPTLARQIVDAIRPPRKAEYQQVFEPSLKFKSADAARLESADHLGRAVIVYANKEALDLFGFINAPKTLGKLWSGLPKATNDSRWQEQLFDAVQHIANGRQFQPPQAVFKTKAGGVYRPIAFALTGLATRQGLLKRSISSSLKMLRPSTTPRCQKISQRWQRFSVSPFAFGGRSLRSLPGAP
jgi:TIR domain-containing protein